MKLKTVKDLRSIADDETELIVPQDELKQAAIEWVKELDSELVTISNGLAITEEGYEYYDIKKANKSALILWIKHFFNIIEGDLK